VQLACLDLEGVLVPEIWIEFAKRTNIPELSRTTRDEPDYDKLMKGRLAILEQHKLGLPDIQKVIAEMGPLHGAREFLDGCASLPGDHPVGHAYEFAHPLMRRRVPTCSAIRSRRTPTACSSTTGCAWPTRSARPCCA
jgi:phosphoserine/homoserine phosphotransferase